MEQSNKTATDWSSYSVYECDQTHTNAARAKYPPYPTTSIIPKTIEVNGEEVINLPGHSVHVSEFEGHCKVQYAELQSSVTTF